MEWCTVQYSALITPAERCGSHPPPVKQAKKWAQCGCIYHRDLKPQTLAQEQLVIKSRLSLIYQSDSINTTPLCEQMQIFFMTKVKSSSCGRAQIKTRETREKKCILRVHVWMVVWRRICITTSSWKAFSLLSAFTGLTWTNMWLMLFEVYGEQRHMGGLKWSCCWQTWMAKYNYFKFVIPFCFWWKITFEMHVSSCAVWVWTIASALCAMGGSTLSAISVFHLW